MNIALIVAAGSSTRMQNKTPKQFLKLYGQEIILYSLITFQKNSMIDHIVIVTKEEYIAHVNNLCKKNDINKVSKIVAGGKSRQESVYLGLIAMDSIINNEKDSIVLIHDGARPFINDRIIEENIIGANKYGAIVTAIPSIDTILKSENGKIVSELQNRSEEFIVQTPQSFKYNIILNAHINAIKNNISNATDDCSLVYSINNNINIVLGERTNIKITDPLDITLAKNILKNQ